MANAVVFYADDCGLEESDGCTIAGVIKDNSANAVVGATVQLSQGGTVLKTTTSIAGGAYTFGVTPNAGDVYEVNATKLNYSSPAANVSVTTVTPPGVATAGDIVLTALPTVIVSGIVTNATGGAAIADATVTVLGASGSQSTKTGADGKYSFTVASGLPYILTARKLPLGAPAQNIFPDVNLTVDFGMSSAVMVGAYAESLASGSLSSWTNAGTLGGKFVPLATAPVASQSGLYKAVIFTDNPMILVDAALNNYSGSYVGAPAEITGATASYTVSAWLLEPDATLPDQQTYVSWAKRGTTGANCEMDYGVNGSYGAVGHWGDAADMGWGTPPTGGVWHNVIITYDYMTGVEAAYIDGVFSKSEIKTLDIGVGLPIILGSGYWMDAPPAIATDIPFSGSIAQVEIFGAPATLDDVTRLAASGPVAHPTATIQGKVVTADASEPSGFTITVTDGLGTVQATAVTGADGKYSKVVPPGTFTVKAIKTGFVTMPAPQTRTVAVGDTATMGDFTATSSTISGKLVNATTGAAIYNGVVQVGGKGGLAMITDQAGNYSQPATGCGSFELFADGLGYHCRNLVFTNVGNLSFKIALNPEVETGVITNGGFENVAGGLPASWIQGWDPTAPIVPITEFWATNVPYSGTSSAFVTGAGAFDPLSQFIPSDPAAVYNCYCKAVGTNMESPGAVWFPMFAFRASNFDEMKGWISGEPAPYEGWTHNAPTNWMQYLQFHTYSGDATQPFVRIAPPVGAAWLSATFCFTGNALTSDQGVFVDDVVMDKVPANVPLEPVAPDGPVTLTIERVGNGVKLTWPQGTLLQSSSLTGSQWTTNSATSPYTNTSPVGQLFYKVIVR